MHLRLKRGVDIGGLKPEMALCATIVTSVYAEFDNAECVITSALDGKHSDNSLHYTGYALDFRIWQVPKEMHRRLVNRIRFCLGDDFDVVLETTHIHVEYDPK